MQIKLANIPGTNSNAATENGAVQRVGATLFFAAYREKQVEERPW